MIRNLLLVMLCASCFAQTAIVVRAPEVKLPAAKIDGNDPAVWVDGQLSVFTSTGTPVRMEGAGLLHLSVAGSPTITPTTHLPLWIESAWRDDDGTVYAWYHHEPAGPCPGNYLTAPKIGALISHDGGATFTDLGIVLESSVPINCDSPNGYFGSGHGDFSVSLDRNRQYFYFLFTNYGGPLEQQGVAMARLAFEDRSHPVGAVYKLAKGTWAEPGLGGSVTPILRTRVSWDKPNTDSFWGPAIHWNTAIERYVVLLNRSCCSPGWPQEGIYMMFGEDLADAATWSKPRKIIDGPQLGISPGYYPQVFGSGVGETDTLAGDLPRLFVQGVSKWAVRFIPQEPDEPPCPKDDPTFEVGVDTCGGN